MEDEIPLSLRQLQYFAVVAETGSVTRAARRLLISQPALSHQLRVLEAGVGTPLFQRRARGVVLTPAGRAMLPAARSALASSEDARRSARAAAGLQGGELRVATSLSLALGVLPRILREWFATHPDVEVRVHEHSHADLVQSKVASGDADIALGVRPDAWGGPLFDLGDETLVVVTSSNDPLARRNRGRIAIGDLRDRRWVLPAITDGFSDYLERLCAKAGFVPAAAVRSSGVGTLVALAASGLGPALVPANAVPDPAPGAILLPDPPIRRSIAVYASAANEELGRAFADCALRCGGLTPHTVATSAERRVSTRRRGAERHHG